MVSWSSQFCSYDLIFALKTHTAVEHEKACGPTEMNFVKIAFRSLYSLLHKKNSWFTVDLLLVL